MGKLLHQCHSQQYLSRISQQSKYSAVMFSVECSFTLTGKTFTKKKVKSKCICYNPIETINEQIIVENTNKY